MKRIYITPIATFLLALISFFPTTSKASHNMGVDITYECINNCTIRVHMRAYRDCAGIASISNTINFTTSPGCTVPPQPVTGWSAQVTTEVTPICPGWSTKCTNPSATINGVQEYYWWRDYNICAASPNCTFNLTWSHSARNAAITSGAANQNIYTGNTVINTGLGSCNSSPQFSNPPVPYICAGQPYVFNQGAYDPDGDSLVYSLGPCYQSAGTQVTYNPGYTPATPLGASWNVSINSQNGDLTITPIPGFIVVGVVCVYVEEYRNGVKIGEVVRDMQITVINCPNNFQPSSPGVNNPTNAAVTGQYAVQACPNQNICFNIPALDNDSATQTLTMWWDESLVGGTFTNLKNPSQTDTLIGTNPLAQFCWTTPSAPGVYSFLVTIQDNACPILGQTQFTVTINVVKPDVNAVPTDPGCNGGCDGEATASGQNGITPYSYTWNTVPAQNGATATGLCSGTYEVYLVDSLGCRDTTTVTLNDPPALSLSTSTTQASCTASDGSATVNASGGTAPYTYSWNTNPVQNTATASNIPAGSYQVIVTDANGCQDSATVNVPMNSPMTLSGSSTDATCSGAANGTATVTASNGATPYTYAWNTNPVQNTATATGLNPGSYTVVVTDNNGCIDSITVQVNEPNPLQLTVDSVNVACNGNNTGSIDLSVQGGTPGYTYLWSNGAVTQDISNLTAGTYTVTVTDANNCTGQITVIIEEPTALSTSVTGVNILCNGDATGSVDLTVNGGVTPYTYLWSNGAVTQDLSNVGAGTYTVVVTDSNGCTINDTITLTQPQPLNLSTSLTHVSCNGDGNGAVDLTVSGGVAPYGYSWSNGAVTQDISNLSGGSYTVVVTDNNGCQDSVTVTINEPTALSLSLTSVNVSCNGGNDGSIDLTVNGGTSPYTYLWTNGAVTQDLTGLSAGTYGVLVTDNNGCQDTISVTITSPSQLTTGVTGVNILCNGDATGSVDLTVNGGTTPYSYSWSNGAVTEDISGLTAGNYSVTVTDANGCTSTSSITLTEPPALNLSTVLTHVDCNGNNTGAVDLSVSGGVIPYSYQWSNGSVSQDISNVGAGTYQVVVTDGNGCQDSVSVTITEPTQLTVSATSTNVTCNGLANGTANSSPAGGTLPYTYSWSHGPVTQNVTNLGPGNYTVTVTDANGCQAQASVTITEPAPLTTTISGTNITCNGGSDGTVDLGVNGGTAPYTYIWSNGAVTQDLSNVPAGTYSVTVTDANGCQATNQITLTQPSPFSVTRTITNVSCFGFSDGAIDITVTGSTPGYTYMWSNGAVTQDLNNVTAGTYYLLITDNNGCQYADSFVITQPTQIVPTVQVTPVGCNSTTDDGTAGVIVTGGTPPYTYSWDTNPTQTTQYITGLGVGTYTVTVTDANGCQAQASGTIVRIPSPTVTAGPNASFCEGEGGVVINAVGSGGTPQYFYNWWCNQPICGLDSINDNDPLANPTQNTTYYVQITDINGCFSNIDSLNVTVLPKPKVNAGADLILCGDSAPCQVLNPTILNDSLGLGPYTYQWSPAAGLNNPNILKPCARPDTTTIYTLVVTGANGCNSVLTTTDTLSTVTVHVNPVPVANAGPDQNLCFSDSLQLFATGSGAGPNYQFEWSPGNSLSDSSIANPWASPALTTTYTLTVWSNGCPSYGDSVTITVDPMPTVAIQQPSDICLGEMLTLDGQVTNGQAGVNYTYQWYPATGIVGAANGEDVVVSPDTTTWYYFYAESPNGCRSPLDSVLVTVKPTPLAEAGAPMTICEGDSIRLLGNWYYSTTAPVQDTTQILFSWMPNNGSLSNTTIKQPWATPSTTTWYYLTVQYNTCSHTDSVLITVVPDLASNLESDTTTICEGDSVQLSATGGLGNAVFNWTPAQGLSNPNIANPMASPADTTTYWVTVSESGCYDSLAVTIHVIPSPEMGYLSSLQEGCAPFTVNFLESSADVIQYIWDFGDGSSISNELNPSHTYTEPGTYQVSLTGVGIGGCEATIDDMEIKVHEPAIAEFTSDPEFPIEMPLPNTEVQFTDRSTNAVSWMWDFGDGFTSSDQNPNHTYQQEGSYTVTLVVENDFGCVSEVQHGPYIVITPDLQIPNVFTPNGDGENDEFFVRYTGNQPFTMQIYDRWGNLLFETNNKNEGWDGVNQNSGEVVPDGTYFYTVKIGKKAYVNNLTLLR